MQNRLDRQLPGSVDEVMEQLVESLEQQGLTVTQPDTGEGNDVATVAVADPEAIASATDTDPDAATIGTASISVRQAGDDVQITLIEPVAKATVTGDADLLEPAEGVQTGIAQALDSLADRSDDEGGGEGKSQVGDPKTRRALLDAIHQATTSLGDMDTQARADTLFVLAKAYTAIVSLERTEEIELHLA